MNYMTEKISWIDFINQLYDIQSKLTNEPSIADNDNTILKTSKGFTLFFIFHKIRYPSLIVNFNNNELELSSNTTEYHIPLDDIKNYNDSYFNLIHGRIIDQYIIYYKILKLMINSK